MIDIHLRPHIETILQRHFQNSASGGGGAPGSGGVSPTAAVEARANLMAKCDRSASAHGTVMCERCSGSGEYRRRGAFYTTLWLGDNDEDVSHHASQAKALAWVASARGMVGCQVADGAVVRGGTTVGQIVTSWLANQAYMLAVAGCRVMDEETGARVWYDNEHHDPDHRLGRCVECRGSGFHQFDAVPAADGERSIAPTVHEETLGPVAAALYHMRHELQQLTSIRVLELVYGEVGNHVERRLHSPRELALWPMMLNGKRVLSLAQGSKSPHQELAKALYSDDLRVQKCLAVAQIESLRDIETALADFVSADHATGGKTLTLAKRMSNQ